MPFLPFLESVPLKRVIYPVSSDRRIKPEKDTILSFLFKLKI
ncbi:MAG: hypothetical protein ABSA82_10765 [Thermacetogeniaceae bacterium]|jgi:hypothetical protein